MANTTGRTVELMDTPGLPDETTGADTFTHLDSIADPQPSPAEAELFALPGQPTSSTVDDSLRAHAGQSSERHEAPTVPPALEELYPVPGSEATGFSSPLSFPVKIRPCDTCSLSLTRSLFAATPWDVAQVGQHEGDAVCPICLDELDALGAGSVVTACGHAYHEQCARKSELFALKARPAAACARAPRPRPTPAPRLPQRPRRADAGAPVQRLAYWPCPTCRTTVTSARAAFAKDGALAAVVDSALDAGAPAERGRFVRLIGRLPALRRRLAALADRGWDGTLAARAPARGAVPAGGAGTGAGGGRRLCGGRRANDADGRGGGGSRAARAARAGGGARERLRRGRARAAAQRARAPRRHRPPPRCQGLSPPPPPSLLLPLPMSLLYQVDMPRSLSARTPPRPHRSARGGGGGG